MAVGAVSDKVFTSLPDKNSMMATMYQSLFKKKADVLILGPSTANHNFNSMLLSDSLGMDVYNSGLDGRDMIYSDIVLQSYMERCKLKKVILDISDVQLNGMWLDRVNDTKPYYGLNTAVTHYYKNETDWQQQMKLFSSLYRYNKTLSYWIRVQIDPVDHSKGFAPLTGNADVMKWSKSQQFKVDSTEYMHLMNIVNACRNNNIELLLVQSPRGNDDTEFDTWIDQFAKKNNLSLMSENRNIYYKNHPEFFRDINHLNSDGADVFSKRICSFLKQE